MITARAFGGRRYGVFGLARTGRSVVASLVASGAGVVAWDDSAEARASLPARHPGPVPGPSSLGPGATEVSWVPAQGRDDGGGVEMADLNTAPLQGLAGLVVSPGVPLNRHPLAARARDAGVPVIGDIELFAQARAGLPTHRVVGVTGTNGKSTTCALIHHILVSAGIPARLAGNIGAPILSEEPLPKGGVYVLELSSFQLDLTFSLDCEVAVLTNITPDHLDRHGTMEAYTAAKMRLFGMQSHDDVLIDATGDAAISERMMEIMGEGGASKSQFVEPETVWAGAYPEQKDWPALQGPHNAQNVFAALSAVAELGVREKVAMKGLAMFPGLPNRMEVVAVKRGVRFVNDSKATNPTSVAPALAAYEGVHWIAGGQAKTDELDAVVAHLGHVRAAYLIGESAGLFGRLLDGRVEVVQSGTLARAVQQAAAAARAGDTVLLSPACASFDQFANYEARGEAFRALVAAL